ncbi:MAG: MlaD family protein [Fibrobacter sp.]|jgi:hypothetical protein|nr:MlaD family protein [Fibrobacter sp.]
MAKLSDRTIGYISFIAIIVILGAVSFGMWKAHRKSVTTIFIAFDELGSLQPEDPVTIRGYQVGQVGNVTWTGQKALLEVQFYEPRVIREGSRFYNKNFALMGQRNLEIIPSDTGKIPAPGYIFEGYFEPGVTEALRFIDDLVQQVETIREVVLLLCEGDSTHPSFPKVFNEKISEIEGIFNTLETFIVKSKIPINALIEELGNTSILVNEIADIADTSVFGLTQSALEKIKQGNEVLASFSAKITTGAQLIDDIEKNPAIRDILETDQAIRKLDSLTTQINAFLQNLNADGLNIRDENGKKIKLVRWKGINIIGETAREKAKIRQNIGQNP